MVNMNEKKLTAFKMACSNTSNLLVSSAIPTAQNNNEKSFTSSKSFYMYMFECVN